MTTIGFIHTVLGLPPTFAELADELVPDAEYFHIVDETLLANTLISARILARSVSIAARPFVVSKCQKVQPLQASIPCASAPMRWIEPTLSPSMMAPSARTSAP